MRPLTDEEIRVLFEKLELYIGQNIAKLIDRKDEPYTFRLVKDRVYYISEHQMKLATNIGKDNLISIGTCFGKFTKVCVLYLYLILTLIFTVIFFYELGLI